MKLNQYYVIAFVFILFSACRNETKDHTNAIKPSGFDNITLIFENAPTYRKPDPYGLIRFSEKKSYYFETIGQYLDDNGITQHLDPLRVPNNDTIPISVNKSRLEIQFNEYDRDGVAYLFSAGDTAKVTYDNGFVHIEILNRTFKPFDYNYNVLGTSRKDSISAFELFFRNLPDFKTDYGIPWRQYVNEVYHPKQALVLENYLINQKKHLDSLYANNLLSPDIYDYNNDKLKYTYWSLRAKQKKLTTYITSSEQSDNFKQLSFSFSNSANEEILDLRKLTLAGDSLLSYQFYHEFVFFHYLPKYIEEQLPQSSFAYKNYGGFYRDWAAVYDSIDKSDLFSEKIKTHLKYRYMRRIIADLQPEIIDEYYTKFKQLPGTEQYQSILNETLNFDQFAPNNLELVDASHAKTSIDSLLAANQGKVILLNFWASWCKPCLDAIPVFKEIISDYKNDPFVFISISTEKDYDEWISSEGLKLKQDEAYNYIIQDYYSSNYMKKHHIMYMPRYILYGKDGEIIDSNAPSPEKERLRELIEESLAETE